MATSGDNKRKSLLQEFVDENGTSGLNRNYVENALKNGGGFGATAGGIYTDDEGYQYIKPFRKSGERGSNVYVGRQYGRNETTTINGPDGVNEWFENARFTLSSLSDYNDKNKDTYDRDYGSSFSSRISELMASAKDVEDYLVEHQGEITNFDDLYSSLAGYQNALMQYDVGNYSRKQYYSQWENEDSYNSYLSQLEELERLRNFDTASAQKELDDLNAVLEQAKQYQAQMDRYVSGAGRDEALYISALTKRNSLLKKYGYSDIDELEKTISQKNVDFHRATRFQSGEQLTNDAINAQDFEEYARMGAELSNPDHNSFAIGSWHPFDGEVQNKVTYSRDNYYNIIRAAKSGAHTDGDIIYHYMTDDEVKIHNYYLAKYGEEKADEYLDSIEEQLNARLASGMFEDLEGKTAQELVFGISAGIDQFGSGMKSLFSGEDYIPVSAMQIASQMVREDLADNGMKLPEAIGGASLGQVAYDAVTTGANMLPSILTSSLVGMLNPAAGAFTGAALLGASASGNAYQEMLNLGYDKGQARAYSALVGASEAGLQYLLGGIGKLGGKVSGNVLAKLVSNVDNAFARTAIKIGGNMFSEGAEEYLQEILTPWFENLTLYTENEIELITPESLYSGLLGALTAGFMEGGSTVKGEINTYNTGKTLQKADISAERLAKLGKTFSADSVAYQLAGRVNENTGAYTMGRLFNEIGATLTEQNQAEITKSLERKGVAHDDAVTISETLAAVVEGRTLSERQAAVLNANDVVSKTVMDVIINPNSTVNQRTQNYNEALMSLAREKAGKKATADTAASAEDVTGEPATPAEGKVMSPVDDVSERVLEASADGKTVRKSSGEEVKIARIASTKDGKMTLKLDTGETVNAEDVSYASEGEALVYETVARLNTNVEAANALVDAYDPSMSAEVYARGIEEAYRYGMYNFSVKEMADKSSFASELTQVQRNTAYKLGQIFGGREVAKQQAIIKKARAGTKAAKAEGKVHFDGDRSTLNERQSTSLTALEKIADALGVQIYVFESEEVNGKRKGANGWFDPKDSSIHIDLYAGQSGESTMLFTAAHELTHFIRQWSPAKFKVLANFLMEQYGKKGVSVDILVRQQMEKARNNGRTISYATAYEEVVADSMETMLADGKVAENLALLKEKDQTLWGKIKEFFAEFTAKVQAVYKGMNPDSAEGRYVAEMKDALERIQELFTEGLVDAGENYQGAQGSTATDVGEVRYSIKNTSKMTIDEQLRLFRKGDLKSSDSFYFGETPNIYGESFSGNPLVMNQSDFKKAHTKKHNVPNRIFKRLTELLSRPIMSFTQGGRTAVVLDDIDGDGKPLVATLHASEQMDRETVTAVTSVYGIDHWEQWISNQSKKQITIHDKKRANAVLQTYGSNASVEDAIRSMGTSVSQDADTVNNKFSLRNIEPISDADIKKAEKFFGTTSNYNVAGYLLTDGKMLDFSGKHWGDDYSTSRQVDHRDVWEVWENMDRDGVDEMINMIGNGNIRLMPEDGGINLAVMPNEKQMNALRGYINHFRGEIIVDIDQVGGDTIHSFTYNRGTSSSKILADIKAYFETGAVPKKQSSIRDFLYSDRDYSYNALVSKPDMKVTTISGNVPKNRADVVYYAKKNAASFSKVSENGNPLVYVDDIDTEVMLSTKGLRHGLDRRFDVNAPVTLKAGEIIKNAIRINELTPDRDTVDASYVLIGAAKNEKNEPYIVQFVVNRATNEVTSVDVLYSVNAKTNVAEAIKKESTGSLSPEITDKSATLTDSNISISEKGKNVNVKKENQLRSIRPGFLRPVSGSTISIAELLDYVDEYFPDILPEEVLKHYGHDARPDGKLGENALFSDRNAELEKVNQVLEKENGKLREDVSYLKEMLKLQKTVTGGTKFTKSSVESAASYLMKYANARGDKAELAKRLNSFYEYIAKGEELTWESVKEEAAPAAEWLMDNLIQGMKVEYIYEEDLLEQDLIGQVYDSYWRVSTLRTVADVKQKEINRLKAQHANRMQELKDAHTESVNKLKQEYKASIEKLRKDYRNSVEHKQQEIKAAYQESRKKAVEDRRRTAMRHKIKDVVNELNTYLLKGTKDKHVMIGLQKAVASALDAVNMDTVGAEERIAKLNEELTRANTSEKIKEIMGKIERIQAMGDKMSDRLARLKAAYAEIKDSDDPLIANSHDEVIEAKIEAVAASVGDTALRDMSLNQLEDVYELYKMVLTTIRNANKTFKAEKGKEIAALGNNVMMEVEEAGGKKKLRIKGLDGVSKFMWNNLKPVYAFKAIGSKTLSKVFDSVRAGEDTWARDVSEAREYYLEKSRKYGYDSWDFEKRYGFKSSSGMDFNLNLEQIMSLYAYSKREQALDHLQRGGFVFDETTEVTIKTKLGIPLTFNPVEATAYNISPETLAKITGKLTKEQKAFVDEMQDYLSTTMGAKGNEVSLEMYGVKLFKEKFYFPLKSATQFMAKAKEQQKGEVKIKNSGFSKETVRKANNPIVLTPFMDVWANHVNEMSMYHAFVLPMEDFYRVFNYKTPTSDTMPTESVEMYIQNAYGKGATAYIEQLLRDLNGGARSDPTAGFINNMMGRFKKGAVFASASVVIQQPSAIARALALVDSKYFVGKKMDSKKHAELWAEVKKYAPVAIIKEMGYFDTNMGKSTANFIKAKEYGSWRDKMTALVKDGGYRDEVLSKAPALADELAWCQIWEAVKRETMDKTSLRPGSEEFMQKAGERFTEVIVNTQVYDSVLSRSANMRSKDTGMKMATAFLAEPTTSINMIADALIQGKRGNVKYARSAIGAVIASQILNAILVSFVYAGRDDDEDETYWEKYLGSLTAEIKDSFNLFGYIPFVKDIVSIMKGYDVERSDISVISDLWKAGKQLSSDNLSVYRKVENFAGSIAQMFGLPVRNIMRDARGLYQTVESFMNGQHTTGAGIKYAVMGAITNKTVSDTQQLYEAMLNDDEAHAERVRGRFKDQSAVDSAIRKALRENDPRIHEAAVARNNGDIAEYTRIAKEIIAEGHFSQDYVVSAISTEMNTLKEKSSSSGDKAEDFFTDKDYFNSIIAGDEASAEIVKKELIAADVAKGELPGKAEDSLESSFSSNVKNSFLDGELTESKAMDLLVEYGGKTQEEAESKLVEWNFELDYGYSWSERSKAYRLGAISRNELTEAIMEAESLDREEAELKVDVIDWQNEGYDYVTSDRISDYAEHCESLGVPKDVYLEIRYIQSNTHNDVDANGKTINYSAMKKIMEVINSYDLTPAQKDAVARSIGWSEKNIRKYKLW